MAGHDKEGGQNVMGKTCHKHVMLVIYVRKNKIRSMGYKIYAFYINKLNVKWINKKGLMWKILKMS